MKIFSIVVGSFFADLFIRTFFDLGRWSPDLILLAIVYLALTRPLGEAYIYAFFFGLAWDTVFLDFMGMHAFLFVIAAMLTDKIRQLLWAYYDITRLLIGFCMSCLVRCGEVIFWLSNRDYEVPISWTQDYIFSGSIVTGIVFALLPWRLRPISLSRRSPQTIFAD